MHPNGKTTITGTLEELRNLRRIIRSLGAQGAALAGSPIIEQEIADLEERALEIITSVEEGLPFLLEGTDICEEEGEEPEEPEDE